MSLDSIHVHPQESVGEIDPNIYGHFQEHIGLGVYDGIWVGDDSDHDDVDGLRADTVELLAGINPPVLRWPGGCFADDYHWEDGVGPREDRPRRRNLWWIQGPEFGIEETNDFGTDEFVRFCREIGAEPYLAANVGSGSVREAMAWMEYCNYDGGTEHAQRRVENGHEEPHDVRYWGVGNENWSCGGQYEPKQYAREFNRYANYLSTFDAGMLGGGNVELIACGNADPEWNRKFLETARSPDLLGIHYYIGKSGCGDGTEFTEEEYYRLLAESLNMAGFVEKAAEVIDVLSPGTGVVVDEWGIWYPEATHGNGLKQDNTVRDGIAAASFLDTFTNNADVVAMANIAQTVNVLQCLVQTNEDTAWPTPTYQVFDLYKHHMGSTAVRTHAETGIRTIDSEDHDLPFLSASASVTDDEVYVTVTNRHLTDDREIELESGLDDPSAAEAEALFAGQDAHEHSTPETATSFEPSSHPVEIGDHGTLHLTIPSSSIVGVTIER